MENGVFVVQGYSPMMKFRYVAEYLRLGGIIEYVNGKNLTALEVITYNELGESISDVRFCFVRKKSEKQGYTYDNVEYSEAMLPINELLDFINNKISDEEFEEIMYEVKMSKVLVVDNN